METFQLYQENLENLLWEVSKTGSKTHSFQGRGRLTMSYYVEDLLQEIAYDLCSLQELCYFLQKYKRGNNMWLSDDKYKPL